MFRLFTYLAMMFFSAPAIAADAQGPQGIVTLFRWNPGFRAERQPAFEQKISRSEFEKMLHAQRLPGGSAIYAGCYLAHFRADQARSPASVEPKSEIFRLCGKP
jgi:hypothetical protein